MRFLLLTPCHLAAPTNPKQPAPHNQTKPNQNRNNLTAALVYFGERINALLAARWRSFATQPYFDERGTFYAAAVAGPLIMTMLVALVCYLLLTVALMAEVKKAQLRLAAAARNREQQAAAAKDGGGGGGSGSKKTR